MTVLYLAAAVAATVTVAAAVAAAVTVNFAGYGGIEAGMGWSCSGLGVGFRLASGGCVRGLDSGCCGPPSTLRCFTCYPGGLFCCSGVFAAGFLLFPSAHSLTPFFLTPSSASSSAPLFPSRSRCGGTLTHPCSARLPCSVSYMGAIGPRFDRLSLFHFRSSRVPSF